MAGSLGPLIRLHGLSISQLIPGGRGTSTTEGAAKPTINRATTAPSSTDNPTLESFVAAIIAEAVPFIDEVAPKSGAPGTWKTKGSPKYYASSEAPVQLYERVVPGREIDRIKRAHGSKGETWFCRRSCHRDAAEKRTASWQEFLRSFRDHHPQSEDEFTPTIIGARTAIKWNAGSLVVNAAGERWDNITLKVVEMTHKITPKPLKNRTFPVLQLAASLADVPEFIVVSIPIRDFHESPHAESAKDRSLIVAAYTSIERVRILPEKGEIEWIMATASDAGGVLPQWMQNLAVPAQVAHDVDLFLSWIPSQRVANNPPAPATRSSTFDKSLPASPTGDDTTSVFTVPPPISKTLEESGAVTDVQSPDKTISAAPEN